MSSTIEHADGGKHSPLTPWRHPLDRVREPVTALASNRLRVFASLEAAEPTWRRFEAGAVMHAFQRFDWIRAWYDEVATTEGAIVPLIVEMGATDEHPGMLLPLAIVQRGGARVLVWLGGSVSDYHAPLLDPGSAFTPRHRGAEVRLLHELRRELPPFDAVHLEKQPEVVGTAPNPFRVGRPHMPSSSVTVDPARTERAAARVSKDNRRLLRRLGDRGDVRFVVATEPVLAEDLTRVLMRQKSERYRSTGAWDMFANEAYRNFYLRMTREGVGSGLIHVSALTCGADVVATEWSLVGDDRCYGLLSGFDDAFARFSPGNLLMEHVLDWCADQGIGTYDFTTGAEGYKQRWCDQEMQTFEYLGADTLRGQRYAIPRSLSRVAKNQVKAHPGLLAAVERWHR